MKKMSNYRYSNPPADNGEKWKDIDGYEGIYKISDKGRIWSVPRLNRGRLFGGYILKDNIDKRNRMTASLSKDGKVKTVVLARLVAVAFIRKPLTGEEINHKDENPLNNSVDNLEWCDHKYNCNYGTRNKRIADTQSLPIVQTTLDGKFVARHKSMRHIELSLGFNAGHICDVCNNKYFARDVYNAVMDMAEWKDKQHSVAYVVTRCEEHDDYVEEVFFDIEKAEQYCSKYNSNEDNYHRHITKVNVTL